MKAYICKACGESEEFEARLIGRRSFWVEKKGKKLIMGDAMDDLSVDVSAGVYCSSCGAPAPELLDLIKE